MSRANLSFRARLVSAFSAEEFSSFCFDHFPAVYQELAPAMEQSQRIRLLLDYCIREKQLPTLFDALDTERPGVVNDRAEITRQLTTSRSVSDRNRQVMLSKVEDFWVKGVLNQSLYREARIDLNLADAPNSVEYPWRSVIQEPDRPDRVLMPGTPMIQVFDELQGSLLILGQPGAGKTTLLLELARDLIERARDDDNYPIPVVFNLSTWATERKPLKQWLIDELRLRYDVPGKVSEGWVTADGILPLLDGLDEVIAEHRNACVDAVNTYRQDESMAPLVVCSRVKDYETLRGRLKLQGAVVIQPIDASQVDDYFVILGGSTPGIRELLRNHLELRDLIKTPLMITIVVLTFKGRPAEELRQTGNAHELWDAYIERMFARKGESAKWPHGKVGSTLTWLAWQMRQHQETVYFIEGMQPTWLSVGLQQAYYIGVPLVCGLLGFLTVWLSSGFDGLDSLSGAEAMGILTGIVLGVMNKRVVPVKVLRWSWPHKMLPVGVRAVVIGGWVGVLAGMLAGGLSSGIVGVLIGGLMFGPIGVLVGILVGFGVSGIINPQIDGIYTPNESIRRSSLNGLLSGFIFGFSGVFCGLASALFIRLLFGLDSESLARAIMFMGGLFGLLGVLIGGLRYGGIAVVQHSILRFLLVHQGFLPLRERNLIGLLDHAASLLFLRRVGGGWIFIHRMLLDHLADKYEEEHGLKGSTQIVDSSQK